MRIENIADHITAICPPNYKEFEKKAPRVAEMDPIIGGSLYTSMTESRMVIHHL